MNILFIYRVSSGNRFLSEVSPSQIKKIKEVTKNVNFKILPQNDPNLEKNLSKAEIVITSAVGMLNYDVAKNLKWIQLSSAGANKLPEAVLNSDILVTNSSGVAPVPMSEHTLGMMLMLSRGIDQQFRLQVQKKKWVANSDLVRGGELFEKTLVVVGMGRIGERIARLGQAFGMKVYGIVRDPSKHKGEIKLFKMDKLDEILKEADFVVNVLPLTSETRKVFDKKRFNKFKKGSFFINVGRGESVVEADLIEALKSGRLAGAGLDVFEIEPLSDSSPLWQMDNVILTPHNSSWSARSMERRIDVFIENFKAYLAKKPLPTLVDKKLGY